MKKDRENLRKERLFQSVDCLTEENQRFFIGVLQTLAFAQFEYSKENITVPVQKRGAGLEKRIQVCTV
jgi:hypothetical protein